MIVDIQISNSITHHGGPRKYESEFVIQFNVQNFSAPSSSSRDRIKSFYWSRISDWQNKRMYRNFLYISPNQSRRVRDWLSGTICCFPSTRCCGSTMAYLLVLLILILLVANNWGSAAKLNGTPINVWHALQYREEHQNWCIPLSWNICCATLKDRPSKDTLASLLSTLCLRWI